MTLYCPNPECQWAGDENVAVPEFDLPLTPEVVAAKDAGLLVSAFFCPECSFQLVLEGVAAE